MGRTSAPRRRVAVLIDRDSSLVAAGREVLSGRKDLQWNLRYNDAGREGLRWLKYLEEAGTDE